MNDGPVKNRISFCQHNLKLCADVWRFTKEYLGGPQWSECAMGCAFCERMFTMGIHNGGHFMGLCVYCFEQGCYDLGWGCYDIYVPLLSVQPKFLAIFKKYFCLQQKMHFPCNSSTNQKFILLRQRNTIFYCVTSTLMCMRG